MIVVLPVLLTGGTEIQSTNLVRTLIGCGFRVTVCCFFEHEPGMVAAMGKTGAQVVLLGLVRSTGLLKLLFSLRNTFIDERPDIVHIQYIAPGLIPILAARLARVPIVFATVHQPGHPYGRRAKLLLRVAARLCTAFFCNSRAVEESWFGNSSLFDPTKGSIRKHWTIYNAVNIDKIAGIVAAAEVPTLRRELSLRAGPVIGCVGRLRKEKGQTLLLQAFAEVLKQHSPATLLLVGDGPDRGVLERQAKQLGVFNNVCFYGRCEPEDVYRMLAVMDLVAVPSLFEGFGLAAAEAMAAGRPVVASAVDGLAEVVVDGQTGTLVPPGDPGALAAALVQLLKDPDLAYIYGKSGLERCRNLFGLAHFRDTTLAAYRCLLPKSWNSGS